MPTFTQQIVKDRYAAKYEDTYGTGVPIGPLAYHRVLRTPAWPKGAKKPGRFGGNR